MYIHVHMQILYFKYLYMNIARGGEETELECLCAKIGDGMNIERNRGKQAVGWGTSFGRVKNGGGGN